MAEKKRTYQEMKRELDDIIARLESDDIDIDEAGELYKKGQKLAREIEKYLEKIKSDLHITKPQV
jgi:exodeoxyribonuclease VII small subunit